MEFSHPQTILSNLGISEGSVVVDLGSGSGHYSIAAAHMVGSEGYVYAVDVQKDLLQRIEQSAKNEGIDHLEIIWGNIEQYGGTKLREGTADVVLLCNVLFQAEDKRAAIDEARRILHPSGRLIVVDWTDSHFGMGPQQDQVVDETTASELLVKQGLVLDKTFTAGDHHWGGVWRHAN